MNQSTSVLADAARRGETQAFEQLVRQYMKKAYFFTLGLVGNREDALDISQNAFAKAYRGIRTLGSAEKFPAWFFTILRNEALNYIKKSKSKGLEGLEDRESILQFNDQGVPDQERASVCRTVQQAIHSLPLDMQEILIMQHFQGLDYSEIAELLGIPRGSVASRLYRARAALKRKLNGLI
jgi:RNA polymerase sigma-70 factor (ECF subfamily)